MDYKFPPEFPAVISLAVMVAVIWIGAWFLNRPKSRKKIVGSTMTTPAREAYVKMAISDAVTEAVETLLDQDAISREEATVWYKRISNAGLPDLLPKGQQLLKASLKARRLEQKETISPSNVIPMQKKAVGQFLAKK